MKVLGIIAEYNPFHNGHAYQIETLKKKLQADYCIVAMSGSFTQRGIPAIISKFDRAKCALQNGADCVLELPTYWATSSAETFAFGGVSLLHSLGVVTHLGFGADTTDFDTLKSVAKFLLEPTSAYKHALSLYLEKGYSYPKARESALVEVYLKEQTTDILTGSNNILAIEYLKALYRLESFITPIALPRIGAEYNDITLPTNHSFASASAIRSALSDANFDITHSGVNTFIPEHAFCILTDAIANKRGGITENDFSSMLQYRLLNADLSDLTTIHECNSDIASKILKMREQYESFDNFCQILNSKDLTYSRISRVLLHILLNIRANDTLSMVPYARILGFRKDASPLLSTIKEKSSIPIISKLADAQKQLTDHAMDILDMDLHATNIYNAAIQQKFGTHLLDEYRTQFPII